MGRKIVYCGGCGNSIHEADFERGLASVQDDRPFCATCRPPPPPPPVAKKTSTARIPLATGTPRRGQPAAPAARRPVAFIAGIVGGLVVLVGILVAIASGGGRDPAPPPPVKPGRGDEAERLERGRRLDAFLDQIRGLIKADRRLERRLEIEGMIEAALKDAGDRRPDVEALRAEYRKWVAEAPKRLAFLAHWKLDEAAGVAVSDASGNGRGGKVEGGPTWTAGKWGGALAFDGKDDGVVVTDVAGLSPHAGPQGELTVSAWVKVSELPPAADQGRRPALAKGRPGAWEYALYVHSHGAAGFTLWQAGGSGHGEATGGRVQLNRWHHVAGVAKKRQYVKAYLDGAVIQEVRAFQGQTAEGSAPLWIGRRADGQFFKGAVDDVRIYGRALADAEIKSLAEGREP